MHTPAIAHTRSRSPRPAACARVLAAASLAPLFPACAPPSALRPTLAFQRDAVDRAHDAVEQDYRLLALQAQATLDARERLLLGRAHRELIERGHVTPDLEADPAAFDRDLADPAAQAALINDVRLGRLSREQAHDFLHDYALSLRMVREGRPLRDAMLARLQPVAEARRDRALIAESIESRRRSVLALLDDARRGTSAVDDYAARGSLQDDPRFTQDLNAPGNLWRQLLLTPPPDGPAKPSAEANTK